MDVDSPQDGGREQGVLKEDEEAAQGPAVLLTVSPSRLAPNLTALDQSCVALSPGASRHCVPSPLLQTTTWTSQTKSGTHLYLGGNHRAQQTLPRPTFLSSDL